MALSQEMVEQMSAWCFQSLELHRERRKAWRHFFGEDDPRPVEYWGNTDELVSRERRFLGWFMLDYLLPGGEKPAEVAARRLYTGSDQAEALKAVSGARYLFAVVAGVDRRTIYLEVEEESFQVRSPAWAAQVRRHQALVAHILPARHGYWLPAPGWLIWPTTIGPEMRSHLKEMQTDAVSLERSLQGRFDREEKPELPRPTDDTLEAAVARMDRWAKEKGYPQLAMTADQWRELVLRYMVKLDTTAFTKDVVGMVGAPVPMDDLQEILALSNNIWNNTPRPDRWGMSPNQLVRLQTESGTGSRGPAPARKKPAPKPQKRWAFDPDSGGKRIPETVRRQTEQRIRRYAQEHFAGRYTRLDIRFRGQFCYIDAYIEPPPPPPNWPPPGWPETPEETAERLRNTPLHLCRLRYFGDQERWGFAFYTYSHERYELSMFPSGEFFGPPEEAFRVAAEVYLSYG